MAFKMQGSAFTKKPIKFDEDKDMEYVMHKGKKVYGSWNELSPNKNNKVKTRGLSDHIFEKDGDFYVNEGSWDSHLEDLETIKSEGTERQQRRRRRRGGFPTS